METQITLLVHNIQPKVWVLWMGSADGLYRVTIGYHGMLPLWNAFQIPPTG